MANLQEYYDKNYHGVIHGNLMDDDDYYWARAKAFFALYFDVSEQSLTVLDYGCGLGQASICHPHAKGYDASQEARAIAKQKGLFVYDAETEIPVASFDMAICRHVLEHVPDPLATLRLLASSLKPKGRLKLILPKEKHGSTTLEPDPHMHLFAWNFRTINNLLSTAGFRVVNNSELYHWGFQKLLPIRKIFGETAYLGLAILVGRVFRAGELVIVAEKNT